VNLRYVNSELVTDKTAADLLGRMSGIIVAPGFGNRGIEGKIEAVRFVRENNIPFLGICLGMQCAVIEFARNVLGLADADSSEMRRTSNPVIDLMEAQKGVTEKGGTMRLGAYPCRLVEPSKLYDAYKTGLIHERHRHRYEFNNAYIDQYTKAGMRPVGINPDTGLVEAVELQGHPWFTGVQYHPEYKSTVSRPHPLFKAFVAAAMEHADASGIEK
jgi:CTP synthase